MGKAFGWSFVAFLTTTAILIGIGATKDSIVLSSLLIVVVPTIVYNLIAVKEREERTIENRSILKKYAELYFPEGSSTLIETANRKFIVLCDALHRQVVYLENGKTVAVDIAKILRCEIIRDGTVMQSNTAAGAVIGATLAGGIGSLIGSSVASSGGDFLTSLYIRCISSDRFSPLISIKIVDSAIQKQTTEYKEAVEIADRLYAFIISCMNAPSDNESQSPKKKRKTYRLKRED